MKEPLADTDLSSSNSNWLQDCVTPATSSDIETMGAFWGCFIQATETFYFKWPSNNMSSIPCRFTSSGVEKRRNSAKTEKAF